MLTCSWKQELPCEEDIYWLAPRYPPGGPYAIGRSAQVAASAAAAWRTTAAAGPRLTSSPRRFTRLE